MNPVEYFKDPKNVELWKALFTPSEEVVAHHELYNELRVQRPDMVSILPKFLFYVCNFQVFGNPVEKDANGNLGYRMHFTPKHIQTPA